MKLINVKMNASHNAPYTPIEETRRHSETTKKVDALRGSLGELGERALDYLLRGWEEYQPPRQTEERNNYPAISA